MPSEGCNSNCAAAGVDGGRSPMRQIFSGRVATQPFRVSSRDDFVDFLERNPTRIENASKLQIPLFSSAKGFVF
jgi:hypothetical protein